MHPVKAKGPRRKKPNAKAIVHGDLQVRRMVKARPAMGEHLSPEDTIWQWAARKFAGEDLTDTIDWNNGRPYRGAQADHVYPGRTERGYIRLNGAMGLSFEALWARAVYELHNIAYYREFRQTIKKAARGQLNKEKFILRMAAIEFKAVKRTERFYLKVWTPWAKKQGIPASCPNDWYAGVPRRFKEWIGHFGKECEYPWKTYAAFYDNELKAWAKE